jgi:hypothetical protein
MKSIQQSLQASGLLSGAGSQGMQDFVEEIDELEIPGTDLDSTTVYYFNQALIYLGRLLAGAKRWKILKWPELIDSGMSLSQTLSTTVDEKTRRKQEKLKRQSDKEARKAAKKGMLKKSMMSMRSCVRCPKCPFYRGEGSFSPARKLPFCQSKSPILFPLPDNTSTSFETPEEKTTSVTYMPLLRCRARL